MRRESFANNLKVDLSDAEEKEALRRIAGISMKYQRLTSKKLQNLGECIVHVRENIYGKSYT